MSVLKNFGLVLVVLLVLALFPAGVYGTHRLLGTHWLISAIFMLNGFLAYFALSHFGTMVGLQSAFASVLVYLYLIALFLSFVGVGAYTLYQVTFGMVF